MRGIHLRTVATSRRRHHPSLTPRARRRGLPPCSLPRPPGPCSCPPSWGPDDRRPRHRRLRPRPPPQEDGQRPRGGVGLRRMSRRDPGTRPRAQPRAGPRSGGGPALPGTSSSRGWAIPVRRRDDIGRSRMPDFRLDEAERVALALLLGSPRSRPARSPRHGAVTPTPTPKRAAGSSPRWAAPAATPASRVRRPSRDRTSPVRACGPGTAGCAGSSRAPPPCGATATPPSAPHACPTSASPREVTAPSPPGSTAWAPASPPSTPHA